MNHLLKGHCFLFFFFFTASNLKLKGQFTRIQILTLVLHLNTIHKLLIYYTIVMFWNLELIYKHTPGLVSASI